MLNIMITDTQTLYIIDMINDWLDWQSIYPSEHADPRSDHEYIALRGLQQIVRDAKARQIHTYMNYKKRGMTTDEANRRAYGAGSVNNKAAAWRTEVLPLMSDPRRREHKAEIERAFDEMEKYLREAEPKANVPI